MERNTKLTNEQKESLVEQLFVKGGLSVNQIFENTGITPKTIRKYITTNELEKKKVANSMTRQTLVDKAYLRLQKIDEQIETKYQDENEAPPKTLIDEQAILVKRIEALSKYPLHKYCEVMEDFHVWLSRVKPKQLLDTVKLTSEFIESLATKEGVS